MNFHSLIPSRGALALLCGVTIAVGIATAPARADLYDKKTILTVNQPIQITNTVLQPGQYVMKLFDSQSDRHIVQIFNRDQTHIINTILAIPRERLEPTSRTQFTFWETPPGTYKAMRTWFYPGDLIGQEFPYPKHLQQIAMVTPSAPPPAPEAAPPPPPEQPAPAPEAAAPQPAPEQQPPEVAQNTTPAPPETPAQTTPMKPAELPKTGSPYPAIGICGALLIGLAGLLRLRRQV